MSFIKPAKTITAERQRLAECIFYDVQQSCVIFSTTQETVTRLLPAPFKPVDPDFPTGGAFVAHFGDTSFGQSYEECGLWLDAEYEGVAGSFWISMTLNSDMGLALGRERYGLPKKMADVQFRLNNDRITGSVARRGSNLLDMAVDLSKPCNNRDFQGMAEQEWAGDQVSFIEYNVRDIPSPDGTSTELGPQLVRGDAYFKKRSARFGHAELAFHSSRHDPYEEVAIEQILGAVYVEGDYHLPPGNIRAKLDPEAYAPYSFMRYDDLSDLRRKG